MMSRSSGWTIPKNYNELESNYGKLIIKVLRHCNKIESNFEDLHSYVWVKLLEAQFLVRFEQYTNNLIPKVLTGIEVCAFLGISWEQWATAMRAYHKGLPRKNKDGSYKRGPRKKRGGWMPAPINLAEYQAAGLCGFTTKTALFALEDIIQLTLEERVFKNGSVHKAFSIMGRDVQNGVVVGESRPEGFLKFPEVSITKSQFQNYLVMAVLNHYSNFCRTQFRRHKERPYTVPTFLQDDDNFVWEATLPDLKALDADAMVALNEARKMFSETLAECFDGVKACKPVEEHEIEIFDLLENGASLLQALKQSEVPSKVRRSFIETVQPLAEEYFG